jgi:hypothetical protein
MAFAASSLYIDFYDTIFLKENLLWANAPFGGATRRDFVKQGGTHE